MTNAQNFQTYSSQTEFGNAIECETLFRLFTDTKQGFVSRGEKNL